MIMPISPIAAPFDPVVDDAVPCNDVFGNTASPIEIPSSLPSSIEMLLTVRRALELFVIVTVALSQQLICIPRFARPPTDGGRLFSGANANNR
jgi:hypothetical protein